MTGGQSEMGLDADLALLNVLGQYYFANARYTWSKSGDILSA